MADTTQYKKLLPRGDDSDDSESESNDLTVITDRHINAPEVNTRNSSRGRKKQNGTGYHFDQAKTARSGAFCSPTNAAVIFAGVLLILGAGYLVGFMIVSSPGTEREGLHNAQKRSENWRTKMNDWGTESCIRLVDVDQDGVLDIVIGLALGKDVSTMLTESSMEKFCTDNGMSMPCAGAVVALRGRDGKFLWKANTYAEVFELVCHGVDINQDGVDDCVATGRLAEMRAINPLNGEILWVADAEFLKRGWNIYAPAMVPDLDNDGVNDIVIAHGGDPTVKAENHDRRSGYIMLISGRTGKTIGQPMKTPNERETYMSPVVHVRRDGSQYLLLGTGGETVDGIFLAYSIPDFYRAVTGKPADHPVPNTRGAYTQWGPIPPSQNGSIPIFKSEVKGVMVPPVLIDVNQDGVKDILMSAFNGHMVLYDGDTRNLYVSLSEVKGVMVPPVLIDVNQDGVKDILMSAFNGHMVLYDGETLAPIWKVAFPDRESYSSPAPGYFTDDDIVDFMVHWSLGAWPFYNHTDTVVIDGKDGTVLWNLTTNKYDVTSDLVLRTTEPHRDLFLFRAQGRHGQDTNDQGAIHGATGIQRVLTRRAADDGDWSIEDTEITEHNTDMSGILLPESHFRNSRAVIDKDYVECESDQQVFLAEVFALDRTVLRAPLKLWQRGSEKYFYKLTDDDKELVQSVIKQYGVNHTMTENEVPWSRGKKRGKMAAGDEDSFCILVQPDERTTGAIGDVDGDGKLDLIVNLVSVGVLRDQFARYVKMKFVVDIYKVSIEDAMGREIYTPMNVTVHNRMGWLRNERKVTELEFLPTPEQIWGGYMGTRGDSNYHG